MTQYLADTGELAAQASRAPTRRLGTATLKTDQLRFPGNDSVDAGHLPASDSSRHKRNTVAVGTHAVRIGQTGGGAAAAQTVAGGSVPLEHKKSVRKDTPAARVAPHEASAVVSQPTPQPSTTCVKRQERVVERSEVGQGMHGVHVHQTKQADPATEGPSRSERLARDGMVSGHMRTSVASESVDAEQRQTKLNVAAQRRGDAAKGHSAVPGVIPGGDAHDALLQPRLSGDVDSDPSVPTRDVIGGSLAPAGGDFQYG